MPYIGRSTDGFGVRNRFLYLASASDTSVSGADANGATLTFTDGAYVDVYLNGVLLKAGTDYNTNTANTIAGLSALASNDEVTVIVYDVFTVGDMVSATSGGTFSGNVTHSGTVTVDDTTDSSSTTTGSIQTDGGVGIAKKLYVGTDLDVDGTSNLDVVDIDGAVDMASTLTVAGVVDITDTTDSSDATGDTGALRTEGGASIAKKLYVGTDLDVDGTANLDVVDIDGAVDMASTLSVSDNLTVDSGVLLVDATNNKIRYTKGTNVGLVMQDSGLANTVEIGFGTANELIQAGILTGSSIGFYTGTAGQGSATKKMEIDTAGHVTKPSNAMWWAHDTSNNNAANTTNDAYETFIFDSETYDIGSGYNQSNGRYVAPVAGKYYVSSKLLVQGLNSNTAYYIDIAIFVNGAQKLRESTDINTYPRAQTISVSGLVHCDASDYIEVKIRFENVSNQVVYAAQTTAYFQGFLVG